MHPQDAIKTAVARDGGGRSLHSHQRMSCGSARLTRGDEPARARGSSSVRWRERATQYQLRHPARVDDASEESVMRPLLALSTAIDLLNEKLGGICNWLVLAACVVSAANAMIRYAFGYSSNSWLELQWYMFAVFVMFGASYTFKTQRACPRRNPLSDAVRARPALARHDRHAVLPDPVLPAARLSVLAVLHAGLRGRRDLEQCRRPGPLADQGSSFPSASFSWRCKASPR